RMVNRRFEKLFGGPARRPESALTQRDMDLARSIQEVTEEVMLRMSRYAHKITGSENLCLAGGVALNCVGNGRILREGPFKNLWIQPAAGDAGGALGAAYLAWHQYLGNPRKVDEKKDSMRGAYIGPEFSDRDIEAYLTGEKAPYKKLSDHEIAETAADLIAGGHVVGWFQGPMEFGPRALGGRSILGDARSPRMQEVMNLKIKFRESFRPFAPAVLRERVSDYFELDQESPYMLLVAPVKKELRISVSEEDRLKKGLDLLKVPRSTIPAVTHVDHSARIQTITEEQNPLLHRVLSLLQEKHGCGVVINTSFNVRGEPIVCTPQDAFRCFMRTNMDYLMLGHFLLSRIDQKPLKMDKDWMKEFALD
ncbi:MAG TPA: carbamoyltransferase C-terminal domain-containing protein, partial [bacterium]|nr:carbamoyltransferase C-terminal domain-containing protein [bacterium]